MHVGPYATVLQAACYSYLKRANDRIQELIQSIVDDDWQARRCMRQTAKTVWLLCQMLGRKERNVELGFDHNY